MSLSLKLKGLHICTYYINIRLANGDCDQQYLWMQIIKILSLIFLRFYVFLDDIEECTRILHHCCSIQIHRVHCFLTRALNVIVYINIRGNRQPVRFIPQGRHRNTKDRKIYEETLHFVGGMLLSLSTCQLIHVVLCCYSLRISKNYMSLQGALILDLMYF